MGTTLSALYFIPSERIRPIRARWAEYGRYIIARDQTVSTIDRSAISSLRLLTRKSRKMP